VWISILHTLTLAVQCGVASFSAACYGRCDSLQSERLHCFRSCFGQDQSFPALAEDLTVQVRRPVGFVCSAFGVIRPAVFLVCAVWSPVSTAMPFTYSISPPHQPPKRMSNTPATDRTSGMKLSPATWNLIHKLTAKMATAPTGQCCRSEGA
jgi:hypothetical protein